MKRIQDIKIIKKKKINKAEETERTISDEVFFDNRIILQSEEQYPALTQKKKKKSKVLIYFSNFFVLISIIFFFGYELLQAKKIIFDRTSGLDQSFSELTNALTEKNLFEAVNKINLLEGKIASTILVLQSTGQDVFVLGHLYPKGKSSQLTEKIDIARSAHLLTGAFSTVLSNNNLEEQTLDENSDYLVKINKYLDRIAEIVKSSKNKIKFASVLSQEANYLSSSVNTENYPANEENIIVNLQKFSTTSNDFFGYLEKIPDNFLSTLSLNGEKKSYLILFLNNAEIRPGGGFIGSFARVDLEDGKIVKLDFETNIYTLDKAFVSAGNNIVPPEEIASVSSSWTMRDSNIYADFSESAKKVAWFYQQESGKKVDGLISIDTTLFRNLLDVVGEIKMPEYNMVITSDNFLTDVQYQIEIGYFKDKNNWSENQPKKILSDMMPKFISAITKNNEVEIAAGKELFTAMSEKHLLFYAENSIVEDFFDGIGSAGKIIETSGDYLYLSDSNLGANKSSLNTITSVEQNILIENSGKANQSLTINKKHNGSYDWPDGENKNLLRIFLPLSAKISSANIEPRSLFGKTSVSYWQNTKPGEKSESKIEYSRDNAVNLSGQNFDYKVTIQKQPGIEFFDWNLYLKYPEGWKPENVIGYDSESRMIHLSKRIYSDTSFQLRFIHD